MIHIDYADGTSEWLTDEQLKGKHPELYASMNAPAPHKEGGDKLRRTRIKHDLSLREMARRVNCTASYLCGVERGRIPAPMDLVEEYQRLNQREVTE